MLYSSSSDNKSITTIDKNTLKFSPTVKVFNIPSESPGTPSYNIITSANSDNFLNTNHQNHYQKSSEPSCSYTLPSSPDVLQTKGIMKSTPKVDKILNKIWKNNNLQRRKLLTFPPNRENISVVTIEHTSKDGFPGQPTKKLQVINRESTEEQTNPGNDDNTEQANNHEQAPADTNIENIEEEHNPATTSPAKKFNLKPARERLLQPFRILSSTQNFYRWGCVTEDKIPTGITRNSRTLSLNITFFFTVSCIMCISHFRFS